LGGVQGFAPYATFDGATEYFSRADELPLNPNNFSIGGWFRFDNPTIAANEFLIAKWLTTGDQRSYVLLRNTSEQLQLSISTAGTSGTQVNLTSDVLIADTHWHFLAGVLDPSTSWSVIVDGEPKTSTSSVPGNPFNNTSDFTIGASHGGGSYLDGDGTLCFLSGATLTIDVLLAYYHLTRAAFGV
jgi:hypothetical protein